MHLATDHPVVLSTCMALSTNNEFSALLVHVEHMVGRFGVVDGSTWHTEVGHTVMVG